jgi:hypothetical protein
MSTASLFFNYVYAADVSQTTTLKVTGEQQDSGPTGVNVDEVVVVNVTASQLNGLMVVEAQSAAGVGYPAVTLDWLALQGSTDSKWEDFMEVKAAGTAPTDFSDDSTLGSKPTLQKVFSSQTFTYDANSTSPLLAIPPEAISNVDYSGAISIVRGAYDLSPTSMGGSANRILGAPITAESGDLSTDDKKAVRGLFLQALAAGRYQQSSPGVTGGADLPAGASPGFNFMAGDIVNVYTLLTLTKTREFIPDTADVLPGAGGMKFKVDGVDVTIGDTNTADDFVSSDPKTWAVQWVLTVA